jgi:hypothetical protein
MPKRLIDGESLWKSSKLLRVSARYRSEYANLVPLAEANGVFECDPGRIWAEIYAYNRTDVTAEDVVQFMDEFEKAGMLSRWEENGKIWGYWVGIDKHLPSLSAIKRGDYGIKKRTPNPPEWAIQGKPTGTPCGIQENHTIGLGLGLGFGLGIGESDTEMRKKNFEVICFKRGLTPDPRTSQSWSMLDSICDAWGESEVLRVFEEWLTESQGIRFPISVFVNKAPSLVQKMDKPVDTEGLDKLAGKLYKMGGAVFAGKEYAGLGKLRSEYSDAEIESAWKLYVDAETGSPAFLPKKFIDGGCRVLVLVIRERKLEAEAQEKQIAEIKSKVAKEGAAMVATGQLDELSDEDVLRDLGFEKGA